MAGFELESVVLHSIGCQYDWQCWMWMWYKYSNILLNININIYTDTRSYNHNECPWSQCAWNVCSSSRSRLWVLTWIRVYLLCQIEFGSFIYSSSMRCCARSPDSISTLCRYGTQTLSPPWVVVCLYLWRVPPVSTHRHHSRRAPSATHHVADWSWRL